MPSKSPAQHRLMEAAAHNPSFAKKAGVPMSVAKDFVKADSACCDKHMKNINGHRKHRV